MVFSGLPEEEARKPTEVPRSISPRNRNLADDLHTYGSPHVNSIVIVMDALKVFNPTPLIWALKNLIQGQTIITLFGVMPYLNIPYYKFGIQTNIIFSAMFVLPPPVSIKAWSDIWTLHEGEYLSMVKDSPEQGTRMKYLKFHAIGDLCQSYGVPARMKVRMGYPQKLLVVEETSRLHATWVVLHKHFRKDAKYFAETIPCNMVVVNEKGEGDMIRSRSLIDDGLSTPGQSPASLIPTPRVIINGQLCHEKALEKQEKESLDGYMYFI